MALSICSNCKFWRRGGQIARVTLDSTDVEILIENPPAKSWEPHKIAVLVDHTEKIGLCLHEAVRSDYVEGWLTRAPANCRPDGISAEDDEGRACLSTGESFGCIHFSALSQPSTFNLQLAHGV